MAEVERIPPGYDIFMGERGELRIDLNNADSGEIGVRLYGESTTVEVLEGVAILPGMTGSKALYYVHPTGESTRFNGKLFQVREKQGDIRVRKLPLWISILPPLIAIFFALFFREVIISLFAGVFVGAWAMFGFSFKGIFSGLVKSVEFFILESLTDPGHAAVIIFSMLIGGMVAIISKNGGMLGVVNWLARYANSARNAQFVTWFMGIAIFFDDYANTLIVGNTFRPVTDRFRISREKLAYIVDSTAAPIAAVALVTTWIGAELGYIRDGLDVIGLDRNEYLLFLQSLKYSYYPVLTIAFIFMLIYLQRDFGAMHRAEVRARKTGQLVRDTGVIEGTSENLDPDDSIPKYAFNAVIPVLVVIVVTILGLTATGMTALHNEIAGAGVELVSRSWPAIWAGIPLLFTDGTSPDFFMKIGKLIGSSDSYVALLWASSCGVGIAIFLSLVTRTLSMERSMNAMLSGFKTMLQTMIILILAWSLAGTTEVLHTADFLISVLSENLSAVWIPMITFILAALISFSTGSSWSTMAILYPLALPLTWSIGLSNGMSEAELLPVFHNVISVVLAGSVLGDHCSPISDTTVLSSLASNCNHIDHVRTQLPYALTVGGVSVLVGGIFFALLPIPWYINYIFGAFALFVIIKLAGKEVG
jgi:Na+/H+ antiporter NhaC